MSNVYRQNLILKKVKIVFPELNLLKSCKQTEQLDRSTELTVFSERKTIPIHWSSYSFITSDKHNSTDTYLLELIDISCYI